MSWRVLVSAPYFQRVMEICQGILASDPTNPEAQRLGSEAQEKIESEPFVAQFVEQARKELAEGNLAGAKSAIDKLGSTKAALSNAAMIGSGSSAPVYWINCSNSFSATRSQRSGGPDGCEW